MKRKYQIITALTLLFVVISFALLHTAFSPYKFDVPQNTDWRSNWLLNNAEHISLDRQKLDIPGGQTYTISKRLPDTNLDNEYIMFRGSLADVSISVSDKCIYASERDPLLWTISPPASLWHIVPLSNAYQDKIITITKNSPYQNMNGLMNPVYLGGYGDLMFIIISHYGSAFAIDLLVFLFGVFLLIFSFVSPNQTLNNSAWYVGMFSILVAIWLIAE